jgi:hypothetical protein
MTPEEFLKQIGEIAKMPIDKPEHIVSALRDHREDDDRFQEWAQHYVNTRPVRGGAGMDRGDVIKQELLARDEEVKRLRRLTSEFLELRDKFDTHWKRDPNCVGARFVAGQIERVEAEMRAAVGEDVTHG